MSVYSLVPPRRINVVPLVDSLHSIARQRNIIVVRLDSGMGLWTDYHPKRTPSAAQRQDEARYGNAQRRKT